MHITTLGPDGSYCSQVARAVADNPKIKFRSSNEETIRSLKGQDFGVLPVSNKYGGVVARNMETILDVNKNRIIKVLGWYKLPIRHVLASRECTSEQDIEKVFSHPQALLQCTKNLEKLHAKQIQTSSTTERIGNLGLNEAVICSINAAQSAGLHIISDQFCPEDNETQFAMLTSHKNPRNLPKNCHQDKTIAIIKANPDIFFQVLGILGQNKIPGYFTESIANGKGGMQFPTVLGSFGSRKKIISEQIRKLGGEIQVL